MKNNPIRNRERAKVYYNTYKEECKQKYREYYKKNKHKWIKQTHETNLKHKHHISLEYYNQMFDKQRGCCAICKKHQTEFIKRLAVDHCHSSNRIRGLLCSNCNRGLGFFKDTKEYLENALNYLQWP